MYDVSVAFPNQTTHALDLAHSPLKHVGSRYSPFFSNFKFYPVVSDPLWHTGTCHHNTKVIVDSLPVCGFYVVALKRLIALGLLRFRARAYRFIYDSVKAPYRDEDYSLSPPPRSYVRNTCVRIQDKFSSAAPAHVNQPMETNESVVLNIHHHWCILKNIIDLVVSTYQSALSRVHRTPYRHCVGYT